jgi:hypothetical protein
MEPFLSFMLGFQPRKANSMLALMLDPRYSGLGLVIDYVSKEWALQITKKYDKQVFFMLLVCAFKVLNLNDTCEKNP